MVVGQFRAWMVPTFVAVLLAGRADGQFPEAREPREPEKKETRAQEQPRPGSERLRGPGGPVPPFSPDEIRERQPGGGPPLRAPFGPPGPPRGGSGPRDGDPFGPSIELKKYDPEMYELELRDVELEHQCQELSQLLRRAPREQRETLKKQLQELVESHFDVRQARRDLQLRRLEAELEQMRASMKKRLELREQITGRRVAELSGEQNDFDF